MVVPTAVLNEISVQVFVFAADLPIISEADTALAVVVRRMAEAVIRLENSVRGKQNLLPYSNQSRRQTVWIFWTSSIVSYSFDSRSTN